MDLCSYYDALLKHDWYYNWSDDHRVWDRGRQDHNRLRGIADQTPEHTALYRAFYDHYFTGPNWAGKAKRDVAPPLPPRPRDCSPHPEADPHALDPNHCTTTEDPH